MKRKIVFLATVLILVLAGKGFAFQNEPDGFRGLKWGDPPMESMEYFSEFPGGGRAYILLTDKMLLGNATFHSIVYLFYGQPERFMGVGLYFMREENFDLLKTICQGKFGKETKETFSNMFYWYGQKTMVILSYDRFEETGHLAIASTRISAEKTEAQKQKEIEEAEKDW